MYLVIISDRNSFGYYWQVDMMSLPVWDGSKIPRIIDQT